MQENQPAGTDGKNETHNNDINEAFEDIFMVESRVFKEGFREGYEKATEETHQEFYDLGYKNGLKLGEELGYYVAVIELHLNDSTTKIKTALEELKGLIEAFPRSNTSDDLVQLLSDVRAKFKRICALLKIKPLYPKESKLAF